jgi:23S rRNA pseudouridine1911/1915/1917 synthase
LKQPFQILHEDAEFVIVDKPSGLLSIPDRFGKNKNSLAEHLAEKYGEMLIVHRLDRETSGIMVFARTADAHRHLCMQFEKHTADKFYLALVDGSVHEEEGEIDRPIGPHPTIPNKMMITARGGKASLTFYRVLERFRNFTLLEALIKTGRTHQVRVHLQSQGYPLAIDSVYGPRPELKGSEIKGQKYKLGKYVGIDEERPIMVRTSLHAHRLRLDHPVTGERMEWKTELPKDFQAVLSQMRKWNVFK